ncbi:hypothetical protein U91I_02801 [alpha proteobacterium U9-1i]|nr:hypothetical protein U91I_02801 [alpha proteobacterium U9-1i]
MDRPDQPMDPSRAAAIEAMPDTPARGEAARAAGFGASPRAFLGRDFHNSSQLVLRDAQGRPRLRLRVQADGVAAIEFLGDNGAVTRTVSAN